MSEKKLDYIADRLDSFIDKQDSLHEELTKHIGEQEQFQERMLDFKQAFTGAHEALRDKCDGISSRVSWIIGVGSAIVFLVGTFKVFGF